MNWPDEVKEEINKFNLYLSDSDDPYENLELEEQILQNLKTNEYSLLFYRNRPSLVFGRFQVAWREIFYEKAKQQGIHLVRRKSGGGCVYHDNGNLNFCFLASKKLYNKSLHFELLLKPFQDKGLDIQVGEKDDLLIKGKKITGSAFRHSKLASYHHGTLLFSADLTKLRGLLRPKEDGWESKGINSRRAKVCNLVEEKQDLNIGTYLESMEKFLKKSCKENQIQFEKVDIPSLKRPFLHNWKDESWTLFESPKFQRQLSLSDGYVSFTIEKGRFSDFEIRSTLIPSQMNEEIFHLLKDEVFLPESFTKVLSLLIKKYPDFDEEFKKIFSVIKEGCF